MRSSLKSFFCFFVFCFCLISFSLPVSAGWIGPSGVVDHQVTGPSVYVGSVPGSGDIQSYDFYVTYTVPVQNLNGGNNFQLGNHDGLRVSINNVSTSITFDIAPSAYNGLFNYSIDEVFCNFRGLSFPISPSSNTWDIIIPVDTFYQYVGNQNLSYTFHCSVYMTPNITNIGITRFIPTLHFSFGGSSGSIYLDSLDTKASVSLQNQTQSLEHGYDSSGSDADKVRLDSSISSFDTLEDSITSSSGGYMDSVEFSGLSGSPSMFLSCFGLCSSFLQGFFTSLGDFSLIVTISLTLTFALMLVGWFRYK